jgi:hypothetical protein
MSSGADNKDVLYPNMELLPQKKAVDRKAY